MNVPVRVSDLVRTGFCPVRFYREKDEPVREPERYVICKQLAHHLGNDTDAETIWEEILAVRPGIDPGLKQFLLDCREACSAYSGWTEPAQSDVSVISERYGIVGQIDKLYDSPVSFSIVRCAAAPKLGVYPSDRLRIAAYALCLKETTGRDLEGGTIEYIPSGIARYCRPEPRDRRALIAALRSARRILEGEVPQKPVSTSRCTRCPHEHSCISGSRASRLSDLF